MTTTLKKAESIDAVVASMAQIPNQIVGYDLGRGVTLCYLFEGNVEHRRICQWRVTADSDDRLTEAVAQLVVSLATRGIEVDPPRYANGVCLIHEHHPRPVVSADPIDGPGGAA